MNELLVRLLQRDDPHEDLFDAYDGTLELLAHAGDGAGDTLLLEPVLRRFEFALLDALGYGFPLDVDLSGAPVLAKASYHVLPDRGVIAAEDASMLLDGDGGTEPVSGDALLAIAAGRLDSGARLRLAKAITRAALAPHLGARPLVARSLFSARRRS